MQQFVYEIISSGLLDDELIHGLAALPLAFYLWEKTHQIWLIVVLYLVTYLIDLDHLFDYFLYYGFDLDLIKFLSADYFVFSERAVVPFHAWEYLLPLGYMVKKRGVNFYYGAIF